MSDNIVPKKAFICINTWCLCQALDAMSGPLMLSVASFQRHNVVCELERRLKVRQSQMRPHIVRSFTEYKMGLADVKKSIPCCDGRHFVTQESRHRGFLGATQDHIIARDNGIDIYNQICHISVVHGWNRALEKTRTKCI